MSPAEVITKLVVDGALLLDHPVDRELAEVLLSRDTIEQRIDTRTVAALTRAILDGTWSTALFTEPIMLRPNGSLLCGRHRLRAVVESGRIVPMDITAPLPTNVTAWKQARGRSPEWFTPSL